MDIRWAFVLGVFLTLVSVGSSLKCYECGSAQNHEDGSCGSDQKVSECRAGNVCLKQSITLPVGAKQKTAFIRSCGFKQVCDNTKSVAPCYSCDTDLCNSSTAMVPSVVAVTMFFVFKLFV